MDLFTGMAALLLTITPITNTSENSLTIRVDEMLSTSNAWIVRLHSNTPITKIESMNPDVGMECNQNVQDVVCLMKVTKETKWNLMKISYVSRQDKEYIMDFSSSDEAVKFWLWILSTNAEWIFEDWLPSNSWNDEYRIVFKWLEEWINVSTLEENVEANVDTEEVKNIDVVVDSTGETSVNTPTQSNTQKVVWLVFIILSLVWFIIHFIYKRSKKTS